VELEVSLLGEPVAVILVYPIWFGGPPAILKGYVERVLGAGVAGPGSVPNYAGPRPRLLLTIASSGATGAWIREKGIAGSAGRLFGAYLAAALDIARAEHVAIEKVHAFMPKSDAEAALARVERRVGETLAALRSILPQDQGESLVHAAPTA
jgi:NAD(P)H dehydrogenase (quinone)